MTTISTMQEVQKLFDMYFQANSLLDNVVYALDVDFNMSKFADFIHIQISHQMPLLADKIEAIGSKMGERFRRGALNANNKDYVSPIEALEDVYNYFIEIDNQINKAIDIANNDKMKKWATFLDTFAIDDQLKYTHQMKKFILGIQDYNGDGIMASFAKDFGAYITLFTPQELFDMKI
jgi:ferritin